MLAKLLARLPARFGEEQCQEQAEADGGRTGWPISQPRLIIELHALHHLHESILIALSTSQGNI